MACPKRRRSHGKEIYYILCILAIFAGALYTVFGSGGYLELRRARVEMETHHSRVETLQRGNAERMATIRQLQSDKAALEKYAGEKGYVKKGEIVQEVPEEGNPPSPQNPAGKNQ
jgi:cell division protein FtsB